MAQDLYAADRVHTRNLPPEQTPEAVLARYRAANPDDPNATVAVPGDENYAGPATLDPNAQVYVKDRPLTDSRLKAQVEAERLIPATDAAGREQSLMQGVLLNGADELGGRLQQGGQMVRNLGRRLQGDPIEVNSSDLNDAFVDTYRSRQQQFARDKPFQAGGLQLAGGLLTGGATFGSGIAGAAATGAAYGAGAGGLGAEGSFADRLPQAATGGAVGGTLGAGAGAAAPYAQRLMSIASVGTRPVREAAGRLVGIRPEPAIVGARRISDQFQRSGGDLAAARSLTGDYRAAGLDPAVVDVGGQNVFATTRAAAAGEGSARDRAVAFRNRRAAELAPRTIERTRRLTPGEDRDSLQMARDITGTRRNEARTLYADAYNQEITVPNEIVGALRGPEGTAAINEARRIAGLERDDAAVSALDNLLVADYDQAVTANGRALDYVRQAYSDMARDAEGNLGAALQGRVDEIEDGLNLIPELRTARTAYRTASEQIDAVGGVPNRAGRQVLGRPDRAPMSAIGERSAPRYEAYVDGLPNAAAPQNQVYQRDQLIDRLAAGKDGAVGPVNTITPGFNAPLDRNAPTAARNLEATYPGQGQQYQRDLNLASRQMSVADAINPNAGPKSANLLIDNAAENAANGLQAVNQARGQTLLGMATGAFQKLAQKTGGLNEAERDAIVQLGLGNADDLERIVQIAEMSRQGEGPVPRVVREYIDRARNTLGSQSPVPMQLERLLLPARVSAEEENQ